MHSQPLIAKGRIKLKHYAPDYTAGLHKDKIKKRTDDLCRRIGEFQQLLYANQDMDASGKDGAVRSVLHHVNPAGVEVANFKVPSDEERAHDYLWRVHQALPRYGYLGVFNRSHYEAVLVERVLNIVPREVWSKRYREINAWEDMLVDNNVVLLKFFLHLSREEQADRLRERLKNPTKNWKFSSADLATRKHWDDYREAYEDVLSSTSCARAPWHIVPADHNWYRDYILASTVDRAMKKLHLKWPEPMEDLGKIHIK